MMSTKSFYVYMIHLSKDVLIKDAPDKGRWTSKKFIKKNPHIWFCSRKKLFKELKLC